MSRDTTKLIFLLIVTLHFASCKCNGQTQTVAALAPAEESTLKFKTMQWNFGKIEETDEPQKYTFVFTNEGEEAIVLESVTTTCGCATTDYSRKPIKPKESGKIEVSFDPWQRPGQAYQMIYVKSRGGKNRDELSIVGHVNPRPMTVEEQFPHDVGGGFRINRVNLNFAELVHGDAKGMVVSYANDSNKTVDLKFDISPDSRLFFIEAPERIEPKGRGDITFICDATKISNIYGKQTIGVTPIVNGVRAKSTIVANVIVTEAFRRDGKGDVPRILIDPQYHMFGDVKRGADATHTFTLKNEGQAPLIVRSAKGEGGVSSTLKSGDVVQPGRQLEFKCRFEPPATSEGVVVGRLIVVTNDPFKTISDIRLVINVK